MELSSQKKKSITMVHMIILCIYEPTWATENINSRDGFS